MLNVGSAVTVKVRNPMFQFADAFLFEQPEFNTYTGTVCAHRTLKPGEVAVTAEEECVKMRILRRSDIVEVNGSKFDAGSSKRVTKVITGSRGAQYTLVKQDGQVSCTCSGFKFRGACKHLEMI